MEKLIAILNVGGPIVTAILVLWFIANVVGEICELKGKIVPEVFKIRKFFARKKAAKKEQQLLLADVKASLDEINSHYSEDNIAKRDAWMSWVNSRAIVYDSAIDSLIQLKESIAETKTLTLDMYININRNRIIDFASKVANEDKMISREEFNRIFKIHSEYEDILAKNNMTNGEVDVAFRIIQEGYAERLSNHTFLEDSRGY